ncbi:MAG: hypothetical protein C0392_04400 [Syntrophus sp. (in: bacteria)]|nr:hypothetical protein [Syntrophus sp. (in: bacteria)]
MSEPTLFEKSAHDAGPVFFRPQLYLMPRLFDNYYRILWDFLASPQRNKKKGKKGGCAIAVASCNRGEGATTIALNLATAFSTNSTKNVLLVDGNLRDPVLHQHFSVSREDGLTELIHGEISLQDAVTEVAQKSFYFISAGRPIQNPIHSYESQDFVKLLDLLKSVYDLIIFDSSPIIRYPETPILGNVTDGMILVLQAESTRWEVAVSAKNNLETADVNVIGAILNKKEFFIPRWAYKLL